MPSFCAVLDCVDKYGHGRTVPFHKFPVKNTELLEKWVYFTQRPKEWRPSRWASVCGLHFRDEDYRSSEQKKLLKKNAIPSVRTTKNGITMLKSKESSSKENDCYSDYELEKDLASYESHGCGKKIDQPNSKCRFCGRNTSSYDSFANNFEIFGAIQKCLPTLSIRQDDDMPKEICCKCLKRLECFASFIDKVLETQTSLIRQFRQEKDNAKPMERALKIKQEPVVRVKQENFEDVIALFPDEIDDAGEQENDASNSESQLDQKIQFCGFPELNDRDIMEIINLSEPFIDITNCENTLAEEEQQQQQDIQSTALQEHDYANAAGSLKEELEIKNCYKTEKIEAEDYDNQAEQHTLNCGLIENDPASSCNLGSFIDEATAADVAAITTIETTLPTNEMERSIKPIVTSVSSFNENTITNYSPTMSFPAEEQQQSNQQQHIPTTRKRPNIVVLNESIVQSSHTFHACTICQSKFIGVESLNQHYATAHVMEPPVPTVVPPIITPMVMVPTANLTAAAWQGNLPQQVQQLSQENCKVEKDTTTTFNLNGHQTCNQNYNTPDEHVMTAMTSDIDISNKRCSKNEIKILDMQQSFVHEYNYPNLLHFDQEQLNMNFNTAQIDSISGFPLQTHTAVETTYSAAAPVNMELTTEKSPQEEIAPPDVLTAKYMALQKCYERLRQKCQRLSYRTRLKKISKSKFRFHCRICSAKFSTILQLLHHRQTAAFHRPRKQRSNFFASCPGCEKFFCNKVSLFNHMRYICQSLPLSWFKSQVRSFKCRCCRLITFTHWRLYRRHEIKCRQRRKSKLNESRKPAPSVAQTKSSLQTHSAHDINATSKNCKGNNQPSPDATRKRRNRSQGPPYTCQDCKKVFSSSSSLSQHRITHSNLRSFECEICKRIFKRRNGLTQHVRGFHLKLKPFECLVCKRTYALKGDVKRCKHSAMNRSKTKDEKKLDS